MQVPPPPSISISISHSTTLKFYLSTPPAPPTPRQPLYKMAYNKILAGITIGIIALSCGLAVYGAMDAEEADRDVRESQIDIGTPILILLVWFVAVMSAPSHNRL